MRSHSVVDVDVQWAGDVHLVRIGEILGFSVRIDLERGEYMGDERFAPVVEMTHEADKNLVACFHVHGTTIVIDRASFISLPVRPKCTIEANALG